MRVKKKGTAGQAKNFITRSQAVRKLQISLPDFRRLCIFKGIYPREPRNKKKASKSSTPSTTFYYTKDIQYLLHEPLLAKFRDHKALAKKIAKYLGRGEVGDAARLEKRGSSKLSLDHIVKERYPTFSDALRDLDDALSLLSLFANLPSNPTVSPKTIALCRRLTLEFEHYLIKTNSLRKSFLSIKGIYYQATIQGQDILWLVPYQFLQRVTGDIDLRIMSTFVDFYTTLLGFVNFRLYNSIGLVYPPRFNAESDEQGGELGAFVLEGKNIEERGETGTEINGHANGRIETGSESTIARGDIQKQIAAIEQPQAPDGDSSEQVENNLDEAVDDRIDTFETIGEGADTLPQPEPSSNDAASFFTNLTFFLSRETPRPALEFVLKAFGCKRIGWDAVLGDGAFTSNEQDPAITHQIVDRPPLASLPEAQVSDANSDPSEKQKVWPGYRMPGRIYVQPQWVWDCINELKLLRPDQYAPGADLPPHLSPWVKPTKGGYDPRIPLAEQEREGEAEEAAELENMDSAEGEDGVESKEENGVAVKAAQSNPSTSNDHGMVVADSDSESDSHPSSPSAANSFAGFESSTDAAASSSDSDSDPASDSETETARSFHQRELEAEASGLAFSSLYSQTKANGTPLKGILKQPSTSNGGSSGSKGDEARKKAAKKRREEEEELERRKMMMSRKKRKLVDRMMYGNKRRDEQAERIRGKRRRIEARG